MGERSSSLFAKLTLRSKRQGSNNTGFNAPASSSISTRSAASPVTTPEAETPTSFSGQADYGLGYSSINHERSPSYKAIRTSKAILPRPIEFDRYAEPSVTQNERIPRSRSLHRSNRLSRAHPEEDPLFVEIVHEAAPTSPIQSTVRARSRTGTSPPDYADVNPARPQSPFAINSAASQPSFNDYMAPKRITPRRCHSANSPHDIPRCLPANATSTTTNVSSSSYYAVARGWKKGIYTSKQDAEQQIRNFPGPLMQIFLDRTAAESFLADSGRFTPTPKPSFQDESEDEFIERTRIFKGLNPNSDLARRRTITIMTERKEAQRKSRILRATQSPVLGHETSFTVAAAAVADSSPTLSIYGKLLDTAPVSPIEEINGFTDFAATPPLPSMTLLPVKNLANSMTFYAKVLDFSCVSHAPDAQAVMSSPAAAVCLRNAAQAPPSPNGAKMTHTNSNGAPRSSPLALGRPALPTMSEEHPDEADAALPPTPDSLSLACADPEPIKLPPTSLPLRSRTSSLSGITVLVEHGGALEALHSRLTARLNEWRLERAKHAQSRRASIDGAKILGDVQQTPWDAQELHVSDLDGHRIIFTTPLPRGSPALGSV